MTDERKRLWLTIPEAAVRANRTEALIGRWANEGKIVAERAASVNDERGVWLVYWPSVVEYIEKYGRKKE